MFVGPSPEAIALMGSKTAARQAAIAAGVPVVPGTEAPFEDDATDAEIVRRRTHRLSARVKAVAGGGGKGMRTSRCQQISAAFARHESEAGSAFGDTAVYLERSCCGRDTSRCSCLAISTAPCCRSSSANARIQRRHQKVVEESPSLVVDADARAGAWPRPRRRGARSRLLLNAGTIEFLLDEDGEFYFLEMNTRLQVEHPVTEMVTGVDLVRWQLRIARGERSIVPAGSSPPVGHAIECRIYAEDPERSFLPSPGSSCHIRLPAGARHSRRSGRRPRLDVPVFYDPMLSKLIGRRRRRGAIGRMRRALTEYRVEGIMTTIPFFTWLLEQPVFATPVSHDVPGRCAESTQRSAVRGRG